MSGTVQAFFFFQFAKAYIHWLNKIHHEKNIFYTYIHAVYGISFSRSGYFNGNCHFR